MSDDKNQNANPKKKLILGFVIIGLAMMLYQGFFTNPKATPKKTEQAANAVELGDNDINRINAKDKDAALTQFQKQMESYKDKLSRSEAEAIKRDSAFKQQLRELEQKNNAQVRTLTEAMADLRKDQIEGVYQGINGKDQGTKLPDHLPKAPSGGLSFDNDFDLGPAAAPATPVVPANPYGPNYIVLKPQAQASYKGKSGGGQGSQSESELFAEMSAPDQSTNGRLNTQNSGSTDANFNGGYGQQASTSQQTSSSRPVALTSEEQAKKKLKDDSYVIPAFSFVEVTTLHGVACPIGANAPGASDSSKIPARPVVLPVHGIFHGPNGVVRDLGTIHLMGLCSGRRTSSSSTGRATIRVEQLSYWDASGGAQMVPATGYIVDVRDNEQDVYGKVDKASGRTLALQSAAAAAAAFATTLSSSEFTNTSSVQNGTSSATSQLTGDATKAAVSQGIGAMFQKISERFEAEANSAIDTILVEPGIRLQFVSDQPISVLKPLEPFDIDSSMYDTLI
ncbi:conjugal transfer protein TraB [Pseudomonas sp. NPDC089569]|uniref:conjugal transfer protein TraB n=1 Tax=Pseudomonas sp. NPDC089569 TaxID=3390722 RepID=UPI003D025555